MFERAALVHYHEIGLKGRNRAAFEGRLRVNLDAVVAPHTAARTEMIASRLVASDVPAVASTNPMLASSEVKARMDTSRENATKAGWPPGLFRRKALSSCHSPDFQRVQVVSVPTARRRRKRWWSASWKPLFVNICNSASAGQAGVKVLRLPRRRISRSFARRIETKQPGGSRLD